MAKRHHHHHHNFYLATSTGNKRTNRHLAALDFLLNIPMENEQSIKEVGLRNLDRIQLLEKTIDDNNGDVDVDQSQNIPTVTADLYEDATFNQSDFVYGYKRLPGKSCPVARIPAEFRYNLLKLTDQSAVVKHWEDAILGRNNSSSSHQVQPILSSRMMFSRSRAYPITVCSIIKYDAGTEARKMNKQKAEDHKGLEVYELPQRDWRGLSYKPLFKPIIEDDSINHYFYERGYLYDPDILDDPTMLYGSHRFNMSRVAVTGPIISSIILYVNHKELKDDLNQKFHESHPDLPPSLTLSKIRSIKKSTVIGCYTMDLEISTAAYAIIYFERLCIKRLVTKFNRYLTMSVCLLLATKFNEHVTIKYHDRLVRLLDFFDSEWEISRKEVFNAEFGAFVHLGFSLHIPYQHVYLVYLRLLKLLHKTSREYLKEDMYHLYTEYLMSLDTTVTTGQSDYQQLQHQQHQQQQNDTMMDDDDDEDNIHDDNNTHNNTHNNSGISSGVSGNTSSSSSRGNKPHLRHRQQSLDEDINENVQLYSGTDDDDNDEEDDDDVEYEENINTPIATSTTTTIQVHS